MFSPFSFTFGYLELSLYISTKKKKNALEFTVMPHVQTVRCYPCLVFLASRYMFSKYGAQPGRSELEQQRKGVEELGGRGTVK